MEQNTLAYLFLGAPIFVWIYYRFFRLSRFGLPSPTHIPFIEDLLDFQNHRYQLHNMIDDYLQRYGNKFSFYHQGQPVVVTTDEKLMYEVMTKHNKYFENRKFFIDLPWPCHQMITMATGAKAKLLRAFMKQLITNDSVKDLTPALNTCGDTLESVLEKAATENKEIDALSLAKGYVMEVLLKTSFSLDHPNQSDFNNTLCSLSDTFLQPAWWVNVIAGLPYGSHLVKYFPGAFKNNLQPFISTALDIVTARRKEEDRKAQDILDALLAAQKEHPQLLDEDLLAQGLILLLAVHANTSATIAFIAYAIGKNKDIQQKLQQEIDTVAEQSGEAFPTGEDVQDKLPYLDKVIKEVLRLYNPAFMVTRECTKPVQIDGMKFKEGDGVLFPIYSIHLDPNNHKNPLEFNPDRFTEKIPSSKYLPFGDGYRTCVGFKLALAEIKIYFARLLRKYEIQLVDESQDLKLTSNVTVQYSMHIDSPIMMKVSRRTQSHVRLSN